jgi:hypothetical protein
MVMDPRDRDSELEQRAKQLFDASVENLDGRTRARLAQARNRALERATGSHRAARAFGARNWLATAGVLAAVALVAVLVAQRTVVEDPGVEMAALDDLELLLGEDELEMLEELEFYAWLEEQEEVIAPPLASDEVG